jgi:hypothetical protein
MTDSDPLLPRTASDSTVGLRPFPAASEAHRSSEEGGSATLPVGCGHVEKDITRARGCALYVRAYMRGKMVVITFPAHSC